LETGAQRERTDKARAIYAPNPEYSDQARQAKVEGTIVLTVTVNARATWQTSRLCGRWEAALTKKAIEAVRRWKFDPGTKDGTPVESEIAVEVSFHLFK
jgi:protein TonB